MAEIYFWNKDSTLNRIVTIKRFTAGSNFGSFVDSTQFKPNFFTPDSTIYQYTLDYDFQPQYDYVISVYPVTKSYFIKDIRFGNESKTDINSDGCLASSSYTQDGTVHSTHLLYGQDHDIIYMNITY